MLKVFSSSVLSCSRNRLCNSNIILSAVINKHIVRYSSDSNDNYKNVGSPEAQVDRFRSQDGVFNSARGREVFQNPVENASSKDQKSEYRYTDQQETNEDDKEHISVYMSQNISLSAVMQTNVPEPFTTTGEAPVHLNMPGGSQSQSQKYLSEWRQLTHQGSYTYNNTNPSDTKKSCDQKRFCHSQSAPSKEEDKINVEQLTMKQKLKHAVRDYGSTVIVFHVAMSLTSLGVCYLAISSGLDLPTILSNIGISEYLTKNQVAVGGSTFVIAYAVHKVFAPVRIFITLSTTPFIVRYLRGKGILKPPKIKSQ